MKSDTEGLSERQLLLRIDDKLDLVQQDLVDVKRQAAVSGAISGGMAGGLVAVGIAYIKAKMGW